MKKILIRLFVPLLAALVLCGSAAAQHADGRQRSLETIIADNLAQLPAAKAEQFDAVMAELAATGSAGVEAIASMLVPAAEGKNATFEYALNGLAAYVTASGRETLREGVRKGLIASIARCVDKPNQAFLLTQLQLCSTAEDTPVLVNWLTDPYLSDYALRALISTPGTDSALLRLAAESDLTSAQKSALAYAFAEKRIADAEPILLKWLRGADVATAERVGYALAACGGSSSIKPLADAAAKSGYAGAHSGATENYLKLLGRIAHTDEAPQAAKAAQRLLRCDVSYVRGGALAVLVEAQGVEKSMPEVLKAVKQGPADYRFAALETLGKGDDQIFAQLAGTMAGLDTEARAAVIVWLGERGAVSQCDVVVAAVASPDEAVARAAIAAAGRLGGEKALGALVMALEGAHSAEAVKAIRSFKGDISGEVTRLLARNDPKQLISALLLAAERRMTSASGRVFELVACADSTVREAAYAALPRVVGTSDSDRLAQLLDAADTVHIHAAQIALSAAVGKFPAAEQYPLIARYMEVSKAPVRYYPVLAQAGTPEAVTCLSESFRTADRDAAFAALLTVDSPEMPQVLLAIATAYPELKEKALNRYAGFKAAESAEPMQRYEFCRRALELTPSPKVVNRLLANLAEVPVLPALLLCARYLDDPTTAEAAAAAVKRIVAKSEPMPGGESVRRMLEKSREIYRALNDADAGYAVDEITELLGKIPASGIDGTPVPPFQLPADEAAQGYEVLFDGRTLDKWTGNKTNYTPFDGAIDVTASYGGSGNLYTVKEYGDFNLRFEFRFLCEGVNNGIGIRTPMGVDAAYHGMEIQVLDHDAPIYKNLRTYQQHGSVYGIIPAQERVKFGELGRWNQMEINAVGDKIRVTVNGRVILDGNIRTACQGQNVAPAGAQENPYTVDGRNHPGLFNKRGHIGLLGHGAGIQFRNLRIRDLETPARKR